jgi:creatinine amidohydrolase/Fe(II)-dependent formamide hydrolase-like protein
LAVLAFSLPAAPRGVFGDATLATRAKGEKIVTAMVNGILAEIEALRLISPR